MKAAKIPPTDSIAELAHFWDTHDLTDFEEQLEVVDKPVFTMKGRLPDLPLEQLQVVMEEVTDPDELAKAQAQRQRFESNFAWFQVHTKEIYQRYRGKSVCIAGQELFVADDSASAWALGEAAHPEDDGSFVQHIPLEPAKLLMTVESPQTEKDDWYKFAMQNLANAYSDVEPEYSLTMVKEF